MSQIVNITVLIPNGRRQTVKVSPNSTILQILEDVCTKQGFDPVEYDLRHHTRILDTTQTVQYSRLPNNAQVEMVKAKTIRKEVEVLVNLQLETGERLSGSFFPTQPLWDVITQLKPPLKGDKQPSMQYMHQEIRGEENMRKTTLRSLGLTGGRVLFRFMNRSPDEGSTSSEVHYKGGSLTSHSKAPPSNTSQPHNTPQPRNTPQSQNTSLVVSSQPKEASTSKPTQSRRSSLSPPPLTKTITEDPAPGKRYSPPPGAKSIIPNVAGKNESGTNNSPGTGATKKQNSLEQKILAEIREKKAPHKQLESMSSINSKDPKKSTSSQKHSGSVSKKSLTKSDSSKTTKTVGTGKKAQQPSSPDSTVNFPEESSTTTNLLEAPEREPMVFSRAMQNQASSEDLPDEFFELTIDDVKYLYRDMRNKLSDMHETPLQTSALRELEESKRVLNHLHKYKRAVLRIEFPDQNVLQGTFSAVETVENVYEFVREYLEDPTIPFYLYTTPPKYILPRASKLVEANCVPCAVLHFGIHGSGEEQRNFLKQKVLEHLTSLENASAAALRSRGLNRTSANDPTQASTSGSPKEQKDRTDNTSGNESSAKVAGNPNGKVPKWFKLAPK